MTVRETPEPLEPAESGRAVRLRRMVTVQARSSAGEHKIIIKDISSRGLGGISQCQLRHGEIVEIDLPGLGRRLAVIQWVDGIRFGARLAEKIDPKLLT